MHQKHFTKNRNKAKGEISEGVFYLLGLALVLLLMVGASYLLNILIGPPLVSQAIEVSVRTSQLDSSTGVLQISNRIEKPLRVTLFFRNDNSNQHGQHALSLEKFATKEVGILETGWKFEPDETVTITCDGYKAVNYKTFKTDKGTVGIKESWW